MRPAFLLTSLTFCLLASVACSGGSPDSVPLPELTPFTAEQTQRIHEIRDDISALRELSVVDGLTEGTISREQWRDYSGQGLESLSDDDRADLEFYNEIWRVMRVIGPDDDLFEATNDTYGSVVTGFYAFAGDALVLVNDGGGEAFSLSDESTIAHEYVHSFQDGRFDLDGLGERLMPEEEDELNELSTTIDCVIEGDASVASLLFMIDEHGAALFNQQPEPEQTADVAASATPDVPPIILEYATFNYDECVTFVLLVQDELGWEGVDAMFSDPPATTEQVLHVQKYLDREPAVEIPETDLSPTLGEDWERLESSAFGEFDVRAYLESAGILEDDAAIGADGWGGGRSTTYRLGEAGEAEQDALVHIALRWDTEQDFADFGLVLWEVLGLQGWNLSEADDHWYWWEGDDAGYALRDEATLQYDLIFATDATAAGIAKAALQGGLASVSD